MPRYKTMKLTPKHIVAAIILMLRFATSFLVLHFATPVLGRLA
jgi:hypothetical protein